MKKSPGAILWLCTVLLLCGKERAAADEGRLPLALVQAHSHNDYYRPRPLFDALERGIASIEADVFLVDGRLLVAHDEIDLDPQRSLESLYLNPLQERLARHGGRAFAGDERLTLLVDFKTEGRAAYAALAEVLKQYDAVVSGMRDGQWSARAIDVVVTGDRPIEAITADAHRRAALDGRLADTPADAPPHLVPLISENWGDHFSWRGVGPMPEDQRTRLRTMVEGVHAQRRRLRFWGTADKPAMWTELLQAGVDIIGADNLSRLQAHLVEGVGSHRTPGSP